MYNFTIIVLKSIYIMTSRKVDKEYKNYTDDLVNFNVYFEFYIKTTSWDCIWLFLLVQVRETFVPENGEVHTGTRNGDFVVRGHRLHWNLRRETLDKTRL